MSESNATLLNINGKGQRRMQVKASQLRPGDFLYPVPSSEDHPMSPAQAASVFSRNGILYVHTPQGTLLQFAMDTIVPVSRHVGDK